VNSGVPEGPANPTLNIELLTISSANIWKLSGFELKYILIQQELIFIAKDRTFIPERTINIHQYYKL
jgi:hypothetical protein